MIISDKPLETKGLEPTALKTIEKLTGRRKTNAYTRQKLVTRPKNLDIFDRIIFIF